MLRDASRSHLIAAQEQTSGSIYSQDDIREGFRQDIRGQKLGVGDRFATLLVAFFATLLPIGFLLLTGYALYAWVDLTLTTLRDPVINPWWICILVAGNLFLVGFVLATVRRLVLIGLQRKKFFTVTSQQQPELHAFVHQVAELLGGPAPSAIRLDAEAGLALQPAPWYKSIVGLGPQLVIGLPMIYGLSARQLSGIIAHAYAGYTRESRAYGYPLICSIDRWLFAQSGMARSATSVNGKFSSLGAEGKPCCRPVMRFFDFLSQATFFLLYRMISAITFIASRRIDMMGDLFSAQVAGSTEFRSTQFRLRSLFYGQQNANLELMKRWRNSKLSDNFPQLVVEHADALQLSLRPRLIREMEELVTPMTRSRIVDLGRIVTVENTQDEGACYLLGSATTLMRDMNTIARKVSLEHYRDIGIANPKLASATKQVRMPAIEREKGLRAEVFGGLERSGRFIRVEDFEAVGRRDGFSLGAELAVIQEKIQQDSAVIWHLADTFRNLDSRKNMLQVRKVIEESQGAEAEVVRDIEVQWLALIQEQSAIKAGLTQYENLLAQRIALAFATSLEHPGIWQRLGLDREGLAAHLLRLSDAARALQCSFESLLRLRSYTQILGQLLVCSATETDVRVKPIQENLLARYMKYVMVELDGILGAISPVIHPVMAYTLLTVERQKLRMSGLESPTIGEMIRIDVPDLDSAGTCPEACHRVASAVIHYIESLNEQLQDRTSLVAMHAEALAVEVSAS